MSCTCNKRLQINKIACGDKQKQKTKKEKRKKELIPVSLRHTDATVFQMAIEMKKNVMLTYGSMINK